MSQNELIEYLQQLPLPSPIGGMPVTPPQHTQPEQVVFSHLDYLTVRYPEPEKQQPGQFPQLPIPSALLTFKEESRGRWGYRWGCKLLPSGEYLWGGHDESMGSIVHLQGGDLGLIRALTKKTDDEILDLMLRRAVNVTRLDFCVNINDGNPAEVRREYDAGRCETKTRGGHGWVPSGETTGESFYIGSDKSKKFVRVYDKAAELKLLHDVLTRIELQTQHKPATLAANAMKQYGVKPVGRKLIKQHADFPKLRWYQQALSGEHDRDFQLTPREKGNIAVWLRDYVGPAIRSAYDRGEYTAEIRDWLYDMHELTRGR